MKPTQAILDPQADEGQLAEHINSAFATDSVQRIHEAIGEATKLFDMTELAEIADIRRESLYRSFNGSTNANLASVIKVLSAMGLQLQVIPVGNIRPARRSRISRNAPVDK